MPLAPAIATQLTDHSTHTYSLFVGGVDVIGPPGGLGVAIESIELTEAGPGDVSSLSFEIDDPSKAIAMAQPIDVTFMNTTTGVVYFRGWTDRVSPMPYFGGQGRVIKVECSGLEILLDWLLVPPGWQPDTNATVSQQIAIIVQTFAPMLHAPSGPPFLTDPNYTASGSLNFPVGTMAHSATIYPIRLQVGGVPVNGGTIRGTIIDMLQDASFINDPSINPIGPIRVLVTVDFYWNFRVWEDAPGLQPDDYTTLTVTDTYAGVPSSAGLAVTVDWSGVIRSVYINGSAAASSGFFGDGSGKLGRGVLVSDTTITTAAGAQQRANGVIAGAAASARGSFTLEDFTPAATIHTGSLVTITDAATDIATTYRIREITKTFDGGGTSQTWKVTFGDLPPASAAKEIKRLVFPPRGFRS